MPDLRAPLIEAAVRPFSDNAELKHSAADFLAKRIPEDPAAGEMLARWDEVDSRPRKSAWNLGLWGLVAAVSAGVAISDYEEISRLVSWGKWMAAGSMFTPVPVDGLSRSARGFSESEKLLLFGDVSKEAKVERKEALWRSDPENPAYFAEYAGAYLSEHDQLPPDFLKTARRIDPTNAWFTYLAAAVEAKDSVKSKTRVSKRVAQKTVYESPMSWEILDQARLDRALVLLAEARHQPKCTNYNAAMLRNRIPLLPEGTFTEQLDSGACLAEASTYANFRLLRLAQAISAQACRSAESADVAGFQEISGDADRFIRAICSEEIGTLMDEMAKPIMISTVAESQRSAAETLGLEHDAMRWERLETALADAGERRSSRKFIVDGKAVKPGTITGGIIGGSIELIAKRPEIQPPLTDADLKPMRLVEHEVLSRMLSHLSWVVLASCAGFAACYRFRVAILSRRLARRMADLLRPADWGWILVAGVVLPFVFVMAVNRLTPLGGRGLGVQGMALLMPAGHFLGLWLLWMTLPPQLVRWRLAKRAGGFGFPGASRTGWLVVAAAAAFVPMVGWAAISGFDGSWMESMRLAPQEVPETPWQFRAAAALAVAPVLWVAGAVSWAMLGRAERHLYRATSASALVKAYAAAMLVIALASLGFKASERYWFQRDWMSKFDASGPGWNAYESKVTAQIRKELRETLGYDR